MSKENPAEELDVLSKHLIAKNDLEGLRLLSLALHTLQENKQWILEGIREIKEIVLNAKKDLRSEFRMGASSNVGLPPIDP